MGLVNNKSLWHHGNVWQCPYCGSQKVRIMEAHACRHSFQRSNIHLKKVQMLFTVLSKQHQKHLQAPFADYGFLALYMHSLMHSILCSALQNLHYLWASGMALPGNLGMFQPVAAQSLDFSRGYLSDLPIGSSCQFISCIRAAVWLFPQVVVTAHLSVWI